MRIFAVTVLETLPCNASCAVKFGVVRAILRAQSESPWRIARRRKAAERLGLRTASDLTLKKLLNPGLRRPELSVRPR